ATAQQPNIIFIISDDQGWRDIGYNQSEIKTPVLDRLATEGARLTQHYVYPTCSPTRAAVISGRNPSRFGIHGPIAGDSTKTLPTDIAHLPRELNKLGYFTASSGKWHLGLSTQYHPGRYGFQSSYGALHGQIDPYTHLYKFGDRTWHRDGRFIEEEGHATDLITDEAIRLIRQKRNQPFFLYVAYTVPHYPLAEPKEWTDLYPGIRDSSRKLFAASVTHMDHGIGRIVEALKQTDQRDNTLIVYTSDNGGQEKWSSATQYKGRYKDKPHNVLGDNRPLRDWKGSLYQGGIRVPAFANWPGKIKAQEIDEPSSVLDWFPTLIAFAGGEVSGQDHLEGINIRPHLTTKHAPLPARELYWNTGSTKAVIVGGWKIIETKHDGKNHHELYHLANDPYEKNNLTAEQPDKVKSMAKRIRSQHRRDP
ncbi:MAG: sulfatase-like hydrolase/transferase, partial [Planctomycetota bacterium]